jgi:hypothetical protein
MPTPFVPGRSCRCLGGFGGTSLVAGDALVVLRLRAQAAHVLVLNTRAAGGYCLAPLNRLRRHSRYFAEVS